MGDKIDATSHSSENTIEKTVESEAELLYYDMSGERILIIFNHFEYRKTRYYSQEIPQKRHGTAQDVKRLTQVFEDLDFKVQLHQDLYYDEIIDVVKYESNRNHSATSCVVVAILTHGDTGGELCAADQPYNLNEIITPFHHCHPTLVGKPKLFFIQACRGKRLDAGRVVTDGIKKLTFPTHADCLILFATVENYVSWRTWLIQDLCSVIEGHPDLDFLHIITLMNRRVAIDRTSVHRMNDLHGKKQMPETQFTLTKLLKLKKV